MKYDVPLELSSCHTALMQGYVPEGHTPVDVAARLLKEKPPAVDLAVREMPIGSPGIESDQSMCGNVQTWIFSRVKVVMCRAVIDS
ncbi:MAG: DUF411 domain-containing protein [Burkholderiales bacterium]|nr:DUF411 domain-containing protein [Burkholderiales bacterium]